MELLRFETDWEEKERRYAVAVWHRRKNRQTDQNQSN
jgi:hypothetical protein